MTYREAIDFLFSSLPVWERLGVKAYKPGLERIGAFAAALGDPQERFRTVHVAGTNGKGSTCHMLAAVLQSAGLRTGLFTSPHLVDFRERIRVNGEMIPEAAVAAFTERWRERMEGLSFFEMATGMGLWWFAEAGCDVAVIEAGLGGRLDSTNIVRPVLSVITNIGLEHTQYLGATVAAIATEKAGIIKPGVPVVVGETDPESAPVFRPCAALAGSEIVFADAPLTADASRGADACAAHGVDDGRSAYGEYAADGADTVAMHNGGRTEGEPCMDDGGSADNECAVVNNCKRTESEQCMGDGSGSGGGCAAAGYALDLAGDYQQRNVRTVLAAVDALRRGGMAIPETAVREGLARAAALTGLRGRWQVVARAPLTVLDTAHNAHGLALVTRQIARQPYASLFMVLGVAGDKDVEAIVPLLPEGARFILTKAASPRSMEPRELARRLSLGGIDPSRIETAETVAAAIRRARDLATPRDMIFIGGSNFVVAEALAEY